MLKADVKADLAGESDTWKASVRSRGAVDVGAACTALGGGGHRLAAGFSAVGEPAADHRQAASRAGGRRVRHAERPASPSPAGWSSWTRSPVARRTTSSPGCAASPAPDASGMPARSTRRRPGCWSAVWAEPPGCSATCCSPRRSTKPRSGSASPPRPTTPRGRCLSTRPPRPSPMRDIAAQLPALTGPIDQVPSSVSAIKVGGVRAYTRVRAGEDVQLAARRVTVHRFDVLERRGERTGRRRRLLIRHVHPGARPRPRRGARLRGSSDRAAPHPGRRLLARAVPHAGATGRRTLVLMPLGEAVDAHVHPPRRRRRRRDEPALRQAARAVRASLARSASSIPTVRCWPWSRTPRTRPVRSSSCARPDLAG